MDACLTYDVLAYVAMDEGRAVRVQRERETVFVDQDIGFDLECEPRPRRVEVAETVVTSPRLRHPSAGPGDPPPEKQ
jgi:hypothetical protein